MQTSDEFTPFLPRLRAPVEQALRHLFGLGAGIELSFEAKKGRPRAIGPMRITLTSAKRGELSLDLGDHNPDDPTWLAGKLLDLAYRKTAAGKEPSEIPELRPLLVHLAKHFRAREAVTAPRLRQVLAELHRFDGVEDWMFRQRTQLGEAVIGNLRLGFRCNQDCSFCWQDRSWPEPPTEVYFTWLDELAALNVDTLILTGGEPTVHKDLPGLMERASKTHGMRVQLQTNAIQFRRPKTLQRLLDAGLESAFVSFHSADPEVSDTLTRARGTHKNTVKGVQAALAAGLHVDLNCVVEKKNVHTLAEHARFIVDTFVTPYPDNPVGRVTYSHPAAYYDRDAFEDAMVPLDEVRPQLLEAALTLTAAGIPVEVIGTCGFPPCLFHGHDDLIRSLPREEVSRWDQRGRSFPADCEPCAAKRHCLGLRNAYQEHFGARGVQPFAQDPDPPRNSALHILPQHAEPQLP